MTAIDFETKINVLIIEDHPIVRDGCRRICGRRSDIVTKEASFADEGLALNCSYAPDVIILDIALGDASGFDLIPTLLQDNYAAKIIVFSVYEEARFVRRALELGASGYICKSDDPNSILAAIDRVRSENIFFGRSAGQAIAIADITSDPLACLTDRELEIFSLLGEGKDLSGIAAQLNIGYKTVANTMGNIKQKLGLTTTAALIKFAVERMQWN